MSNVARVEVVKTPIPSMSADFLVGVGNLIGKSLIATDALAQAKLPYQPRGLAVARTHGGYYPSANLTYTMIKAYRYTPLTPSYTHAYTFSDGGVKMSAGLKATF